MKNQKTILTHNLSYGAMAALLGFLLSFAESALAVAPPTASVALTATKSTGEVTPDITGGPAKYVYVINDGDSITDTIPVKICPSSSSGTWTSFKVGASIPGGGGGGNLDSNKINLPSNVTFSSSTFVIASPVTDSPDCQTVNIGLNTGPLTLTDPTQAQNFNKNIDFSTNTPVPGTNPGALNASISNSGINKVQFQITVNPVASNVSCFLTDGDGNYLSDCGGNIVDESASDKGRFAIVANKKLLEVATNPGQFYFNFLWRNTTGGAKNVRVAFDRTNDANVISVLPKGAQAIHTAVFNGYMNTITQTDFDEANTIGSPDGSDDQASAYVPVNHTLLVTYHLDWAGLGKPVPSVCAGICGDADQQIKVKGSLTYTGLSTAETCTAMAYGFKK